MERLGGTTKGEVIFHRLLFHFLGNASAPRFASLIGRRADLSIRIAMNGFQKALSAGFRCFYRHSDPNKRCLLGSGEDNAVSDDCNAGLRGSNVSSVIPPSVRDILPIMASRLSTANRFAVARRRSALRNFSTLHVPPVVQQSFKNEQLLLRWKCR